MMQNNSGTQEAPMNQTHETYIATIRDLTIARIADPAVRAKLAAAKLCYGAGLNMGARGFTSYGSWKNEAGEGHDYIEICASGEESDVQIAGTTIHELGHVLAGPGTGHGKAWKAACADLGLNAVQAGGQSYSPEHFEADLWAAISAIPLPTDGEPVFHVGAIAPGLRVVKPRPCPLGIGIRGGKSRGTGSGSRLRLWVCECGTKVRVASDDFQATCKKCNSDFARPAAPAAEAA